MKKIYLDNNSTTQLDSEILNEMLPFFNEKYGNPSSNSHSFGWEAKAAIDLSREKIATLINANTDEIIFTSGATESINLAIKGLINNTLKNEIITTSIEHKAVLDVCKKLKKSNKSNVTFIKPNKDGIITIDSIKNSITDNTSLISIMHANNEIGTIQPIYDIGSFCKKNNIIFHVDAAQSIGKVNIDVKEMNIDLLSISSHKIYGPKGIGALFIKNKQPKINLTPLIIGGGQENNYRGGTLPTPLIVGFGKACELAINKIESDTERINMLTSFLVDSILDKFPETKINGCPKKRIPGNLNFTFPFLNGKSIIRLMPELAISSGSACTSSDPSPSHVLKELNINKLDANSSIRIGIGRFNNLEEIKIASKIIIEALSKNYDR